MLDTLLPNGAWRAVEGVGGGGSRPKDPPEGPRFRVLQLWFQYGHLIS
jgi:hypothetical protein